MASVLLAAGLAFSVPALAEPPQPATHGEAPAASPSAVPDHGAAHAAEAAHATAAGHGAEGGHGAESHGESPWAFASRIANFAILAGGLFYLLRSPLGKYLGARADQIRADLVNAAETRRAASADLRAIEERLRALPAEIEALKARGMDEVTAEQARIREAAAAERERLVETSRREIAQHLQAARRTLKQEAADLAVDIARRRLERDMTDADRLRLLDRYVGQVKAAHD